jgi:hypothetical protein
MCAPATWATPAGTAPPAPAATKRTKHRRACAPQVRVVSWERALAKGRGGRCRRQECGASCTTDGGGKQADRGIGMLAGVCTGRGQGVPPPSMLPPDARPHTESPCRTQPRRYPLSPALQSPCPCLCRPRAFTRAAGPSSLSPAPVPSPPTSTSPSASRGSALWPTCGLPTWQKSRQA